MFRKKSTAVSRTTWTLLALVTAATYAFLIACSQQVSSLVDSTQKATDQAMYDLAVSIPPIDGSNPDSTSAMVRSTDPNSAGILFPLIKSSHRVSSGEIEDNKATTISLGEYGRFVVPKDATPWEDSTVTIDLTLTKIGPLALCDYKFGPDGMQFRPSAQLVIPAKSLLGIDGLTPKQLVWLYFDEVNGQWTLLKVYTVNKDGNFYVDVSHFSMYRGYSQGGQ